VLLHLSLFSWLCSSHYGFGDNPVCANAMPSRLIFRKRLAADGQGANQKKRAAEHRGRGRKDLARQIIDELRALLVQAKAKR
jgi:hypothetical protein